MPPKVKTDTAIILGAGSQPDTGIPQSEAANGEAGNPASLAAQPAIIGVDWGVDVTKDFGADFRSEFPKLSALVEAAFENGQMVSGLRVISGIDGFRRGGIRHPFGATEYTDRTFAFEPAQIEAMLNEPALTVELI